MALLAARRCPSRPTLFSSVPRVPSSLYSLFLFTFKSICVHLRLHSPIILLSEKPPVPTSPASPLSHHHGSTLSYRISNTVVIALRCSNSRILQVVRQQTQIMHTMLASLPPAPACLFIALLLVNLTRWLIKRSQVRLLSSRAEAVEQFAAGAKWLSLVRALVLQPQEQHARAPQRRRQSQPPPPFIASPPHHRMHDHAPSNHAQTGFLQQHKARLAREIASLRRQAETFNTPSTYAKCAKLQRLANAKEQELAALQQHGDRDTRARIAAAMVTIKVRLGFVVGCWGAKWVLWLNGGWRLTAVQCGLIGQAIMPPCY